MHIPRHQIKPMAQHLQSETSLTAINGHAPLAGITSTKSHHGIHAIRQTADSRMWNQSSGHAKHATQQGVHTAITQTTLLVLIVAGPWHNNVSANPDEDHILGNYAIRHRKTQQLHYDH